MRGRKGLGKPRSHRLTADLCPVLPFPQVNWPWPSCPCLPGRIPTTPAPASMTQIPALVPLQGLQSQIPSLCARATLIYSELMPAEAAAQGWGLWGTILGIRTVPTLPSTCSGKQSRTQTSVYQVATKAEQSVVETGRETNT